MKSLLLSVALIAAPAVAQTTTSSVASTDPSGATAPATTDAAPKPVKARKFCRSSGPSNSHLRTVVCKTQADWDAIDRAHEQQSDGKIHVERDHPDQPD